LWLSTGKLLRLRLMIFWSGIRRAPKRRKVVYAVLAVLIAGLAVFLFWMSTLLLALIRSPYLAQIIDLSSLAAAVPGLVMSLAFVISLATNFGVLLQSLYLTQDMDFLLVAPIPVRAVFLAKLLQAILPNFGLLCCLGLPVLFGLGISSSYAFGYYPVVLLSLALLSLAASGLSALLVMAAVRVVPARRLAEVLGFIGAIVSILISQSGQFVGQANLKVSQAAGLFSRLTALNAPFSPLAWVGRGLVALGENRWDGDFGLLAAALGLAGAVFGLALWGAERLYYSGWASLQGSPGRKKPRRIRAAKPAVNAADASPVPAGNSVLEAAEQPGRSGPLTVQTGARDGRITPTGSRIFPARLRALIGKDLLLIRRDLRNIANLITPLILGVLYTLSMSRGPLDSSTEKDLALTLFTNGRLYMNIAFSLMFGWGLVMNLALNGFSREGKQYWLVQSAPVGSRDLLVAKFLVAWIPGTLFEWVLSALMVALQRQPAGQLVYAGVVNMLVVAGLTGVNLAFGVTGARLDWDDSRRMSRGSAGCLTALASSAFLGFSLLVFLGPPLAAVVFGLRVWMGQAVGLAVGGLVTLTAVVVPLYLVRNKVATIGMQ
jgi:hypothetical protein